MLEAEKATRTPEARLGLIANEQRAAFRTKLSQPWKVLVIRDHDAPFGLNRLKQHSRGLIVDGSFHRFDIAERHRLKLRHHRLEHFVILRPASGTQRGKSLTVVGVFGSDEFRPPGVGARELEYTVNGFGAPIGQIRAGQRAIGKRGQRLTDFCRAFLKEDLAAVCVAAIELAPQRGQEARVAVAERLVAIGVEQIKEAPPILIVDVATFALLLYPAAHDEGRTAVRRRCQLHARGREKLEFFFGRNRVTHNGTHFFRPLHRPRDEFQDRYRHR